MKKSLTNTLIILTVITLITLITPQAAKAEIFVNPVNQVYNYGDEITLETNLIPTTGMAGQYKADVKCGETTYNVYNQYYNLLPGESAEVSFSTKLLWPNLLNLTTNCYVTLQYGTETTSTNTFTLSKNLEILTEWDFEKYKPTTTATLEGTANKEGGAPLEGFAEISIPSLNVYKSGSVKKGKIKIKLDIPENAKSGQHNVTIRVYDADASGNPLNDANITTQINITQELKDYQIFFNTENIIPGNNLEYYVETYDQAGDIIQEEISVIIYEPNGITHQKKLIKPTETQTLILSLNNTPGYWKIEVIVKEKIKIKLFYLEEIQRIQTSLINNTIIVTNIGNVPYKGPLEITIGSKVEIRQINLAIGESERLKLKAPDGEYQISINDGETKVLGSAFLTGRVIKVTDIGEGIVETVTNPIIWYAILGLFILTFTYVRMKNNKKEEKTHQTTKEKIQKSISGEAKQTSSIHHGQKEIATAISLKTKYEKQNPAILDTIARAIATARSAGAKIYLEGTNTLILLSPRITKKQNNEVIAVRVSTKIRHLLEEHNKKYKDKIGYGLGINTGEIISEIKNNEFKFTTTSNLLSYAKAIAEKSNKNILVSEKTNSKIQGEIKTTKTPGENSWEVTRTLNRAQHEDFLKRFSNGR